MYVTKTPNKNLKSPISDIEYSQLTPSKKMFYVYRDVPQGNKPGTTQTVIRETTIVQNNSNSDLEDLLFGNIIINDVLNTLDSPIIATPDNDNQTQQPNAPVQFGGGDFGGAGSSGNWDNNSTPDIQTEDNQSQLDDVQQYDNSQSDSYSDNSSSSDNSYSDSSSSSDY